MSKPVIVHVARNAVASNVKHGRSDPAIIVRRGRKSERHHEVELVGPVRVISTFGTDRKPLACGARVWIEAADVRAVT